MINFFILVSFCFLGFCFRRFNFGFCWGRFVVGFFFVGVEGDESEKL